MADRHPDRGEDSPRMRDGSIYGRRHDDAVDLRPVVWDATVVTPRCDRGVTIVLRVTYRTLEQLCGDVCGETKSEAVLPLYTDAGTASRFLRSSSAS